MFIIKNVILSRSNLFIIKNVILSRSNLFIINKLADITVVNAIPNLMRCAAAVNRQISTNVYLKRYYHIVSL